MNTISIVDGTQTATLQPGFYWIEMAFDRPTTPEVLLRALRAIGFDSVGLELDEPAVAKVGGISAIATPTAAASYARFTTTAAPSVVQSAYRVPVAAPTIAAAAPPAATPTIRTTTTVQANPTAVQAAAIYHAPVPSPTPVSAPTAGPTRRTTVTTTAGPSGVQAAAIYHEPSRIHAPHVGTGTDGGGGGGAPPPDPGPADQGPGPGPNQSSNASYDQGGDNYDSGSSTGPTTTHYDLPPGSLPPLSSTPPVPGAVSVALGGVTPMWLLPSGTKDVVISGHRNVIGGTALGSTFRFVGELGTAIDIKSLPGLRWTIVHPLSFDPWAPMSFRVEPHPLAQGQMYDFRILSRDKTAKSKRDVLALLVAMGFQPSTVFLSKRNMRVPGRPLTTLSEWFGVGVWSGPDSVIVSSDPFYFAEVKPTS